MSSRPPHVWFACKKCHTYYPTLDSGLAHLTSAPQHTTDIIDLLNRSGDDFRTAASRLLECFVFLSDTDRDRAIEQANHDALGLATGTRGNRAVHAESESESEDDASGPSKRGRLDREVRTPLRCTPAATDTSEQTPHHSQNPTTRPAIVTTPATSPISVRVTLSRRPTHAEAVFTFAFTRATHTTVAALLQGVSEAYHHRRRGGGGGGGGGVDVAALGAERLMMKLSKRNGARIGGAVVGDCDVWDLSRVVGDGWFGQMEIG